MSTATDETVVAPSSAGAANGMSPRSPTSSRWQADRETWRRRLVVVLGTIWILDGLLQFQPSMYSRSGNSFAGTVLQYNTMGKPNPLTDLIHFAVTFTYGDAGHQVVFNTLAALTQLAIGVGLLLRRSEKLALIASACWAVVPWVVGEALGQMVFPQSNMAVTGAPGAALIYIVLSLALWPRRTSDDAIPSASDNGAASGGTATRSDRLVVQVRHTPTKPVATSSDIARTASAVATPSTSAADGGLLGRAGARLIWAAIWVGTALLELEHANWAPDAISAQLRDLADREPAVLGTLDRAMARVSFGHGTEIALAMALVQVWIGIAALRPATRGAALCAGIVVSLVYWVLGQNFGGLLTGTATDPNLGPLMVLFALALWPCPSVVSIGASPGAGEPPDQHATPAPTTVPVAALPPPVPLLATPSLAEEPPS